MNPKFLVIADANLASSNLAFELANIRKNLSFLDIEEKPRRILITNNLCGNVAEVLCDFFTGHFSLENRLRIPNIPKSSLSEDDIFAQINRSDADLAVAVVHYPKKVIIGMFSKKVMFPEGEHGIYLYNINTSEFLI